MLHTDTIFSFKNSKHLHIMTSLSVSERLQGNKRAAKKTTQQGNLIQIQQRQP